MTNQIIIALAVIVAHVALAITAKELSNMYCGDKIRFFGRRITRIKIHYVLLYAISIMFIVLAILSIPTTKTFLVNLFTGNFTMGIWDVVAISSTAMSIKYIAFFVHHIILRGDGYVSMREMLYYAEGNCAYGELTNKIFAFVLVPMAIIVFIIETPWII